MLLLSKRLLSRFAGSKGWFLVLQSVMFISTGALYVWGGLMIRRQLHIGILDEPFTYYALGWLWIVTGVTMAAAACLRRRWPWVEDFAFGMMVLPTGLLAVIYVTAFIADGYVRFAATAIAYAGWCLFGLLIAALDPPVERVKGGS